jgi:ubiquinone/menaquinone biosynthesis C-methylase UbiE
MNYDETDIAANYDRGRDHGSELLDLWMTALASYVEGLRIKTILDLGCGTGRFTEALAARFDAEVIGIDPSAKMLGQARKKRRDHRVHYQHGSGEQIPLIRDAVDLIFMSMVFHHFSDPLLAARECRRVLAEGGTVFLRAGTFEQVSAYPYLPFFPASWPLLEECLSKAVFVSETFEAAGFRTLEHDILTQQIAPSLECYAEKLAAGADSVLARLPQNEFESGMTALRSHAARASNQAVTEPIDVFVFR